MCRIGVVEDNKMAWPNCFFFVQIKLITNFILTQTKYKQTKHMFNELSQNVEIASVNFLWETIPNCNYERELQRLLIYCYRSCSFEAGSLISIAIARVKALNVWVVLIISPLALSHLNFSISFSLLSYSAWSN